jgi:hypothetical protein
MARLALTTRTLVAAGTEVETVFEQFGVDGVAIDNETGKAAVLIKNGGGSSATITVDVPSNVDTDLVIPDRTYTIGAGDYHLIKPFARGVYNQSDTGDSGLANAVLLDSSVTNGDVEIVAFIAPGG